MRRGWFAGLGLPVLGVGAFFAVSELTGGDTYTSTLQLTTKGS